MRPGPSVLRGLIGLIVGLGSYVTGAAWTDRPVACPATGIIHCQTVLTGPGHLVAGLPLAFWGVLWALAGLKWPGRLWRLAGWGGLLWAWAHEWGDGAVCLWCTALQLSILLAIGVSWMMARRARKES